jgi:hypothetical protein
MRRGFETIGTEQPLFGVVGGDDTRIVHIERQQMVIIHSHSDLSHDLW